MMNLHTQNEMWFKMIKSARHTLRKFEYFFVQLENMRVSNWKQEK